MNLTKTSITVLLCTAITSAMPASVVAQTCSQVIDNLHSKTTALNNEAQTNGWNFLRDDAVGTALGAAKRRLDATGDPTVEAYNQVQDAREKVEAWAARVISFDDFLSRLKACVAANCSMQRFHDEEMKRMRLVESVRNQLNEWVQSLGDDGITAAAERVNKASSVVSNVTSGAQGIAHEGITGAVNCMNQYVPRAQVAGGDAVDLGNSPSAPAAPGPSGGGGGGASGARIGLAIAAAGAGGLGLWYGMKAVEGTLASDPVGVPGGSGGGGSGGGGMTYLGGGVFSCAYNAGGVVSSCANSSIRVNITLRMSPGSSLKLFTNHIFSNGVVLSRTDPPGDVTFTGFSGGGWFDQCGPPVTQLRLVNTSVNPNLTIATVSGLSIPVTCR